MPSGKIVWITGGDCNSIGELWEEAPLVQSVEQSIARFAEAYQAKD